MIDLGSHLLRTGDEAGARVVLEQRLQAAIRSTTRTKNSLELLDTLDKFVTITDGDMVIKLAPEEAAVMREQLVPLAKEALDTLSKRYQFTPKGPILDRDVPEARRLRRAHASACPAWSARSAPASAASSRSTRRGAPAGRVQLAGDAVARDGPRHHAADVEQPAAALAVRRRVGLRGAARPAGVGPRDRPARSRRRSTRTSCSRST